MQKENLQKAFSTLNSQEEILNTQNIFLSSHFPYQLQTLIKNDLLTVRNIL